jgi:DNA mismatch repair protein MutL
VSGTTLVTRKIQILPDRLVNQIAAGEVVERPASVVKELVENALDAEPRQVEICIRNGGKTEIRVSDDGAGMIREDALLSLERHATSKIRDVEDLNRLRSFGFRGEALPSIASVSRFAIETAARDGEGTRIVVAGGRISAVEACARRRGTSVAVRNLFFNVPARAAFLRTAAAETRAVSDVVLTLALANPGVGFTLESNGRMLLEVGPAPTLRDRIGAIWEDLGGDLIPISHQDRGVLLSGFAQRPAAARPGGRRAHLFVGGRSFSDRALVRAAERAYRTTIPYGVHPAVFLFLEVEPGGVDVNVHPTKAEVRFRDPTAVERTVEDGVRAALARLESAVPLGRERPVRPAPAAEVTASAAPSSGSESSASRADARAPSPESQMSLFVPADSHADDRATEVGAGRGSGPELTTARPQIWQLHKTYLLAETRSGLIIVDQHSAHERVLFEEIMGSFGAGGRECQRLLFPLTLHLSPAEYGVVEELRGLLALAGFEIDAFGERTAIVHAVPAPHPYFDAERCLREMIAELTHGSPLVNAARNQHERLALTYACKAAIKAGQALSVDEMGELFDRLFATELPSHDIHGRPTVVQLPITELHHRFRRGG